MGTFPARRIVFIEQNSHWERDRRDSLQVISGALQCLCADMLSPAWVNEEPNYILQRAGLLTVYVDKQGRSGSGITL